MTLYLKDLGDVTDPQKTTSAVSLLARSCRASISIYYFIG